MNIQNKTIIMAIATFITMLFSCQTDKNEEEAEAVALNFATNYFGCHYIEASHLCTPESEQWIKFVATNVSDSDLAVLNAGNNGPNIVKRYAVGAKVCYVNVFINKHYINNIFSVRLY